MNDTATFDAPPPVEEELDDAWLSAPRRRSRLRMGLMIALAASLVFLGGVMVQKHFGAAGTAETSGLRGAPEGFPGGGGSLPEGLPGGGGGGLPAAGGTQSGQGADETEDSSSQVIGTLVRREGNTLVVEDIGGTRHRITVSGDTAITQQVTRSKRNLGAGDRLVIEGELDDEGAGRADSITVR